MESYSIANVNVTLKGQNAHVFCINVLLVSYCEPGLMHMLLSISEQYAQILKWTKANLTATDFHYLLRLYSV